MSAVKFNVVSWVSFLLQFSSFLIERGGVLVY